MVLVEGTLDMATTPGLKAVLSARLDGAERPNVVVDLHRVTLLDAGAAGMLAALRKRADRQGASLRAIGARAMPLEVLQITGLDKVLSVHDTPGDVLGDEDEVSASERWPEGRDETVGALLAGMARLPAESPARALLRRQAIEDNMAFATRLARRFRDRGEPMDDLTQVAMMGLVNAVDGYDPGRGCDFVVYATPTIMGEIRRYFRDKGWRIKVPRRLQELRLQINRAKTDLSQQLSASPTPADIARHLEVEVDEVLEAIEAARLYSPMSLSAPAGPDSDASILDPFGEPDPGMEAVENRESLMPALAKLPVREQKIVAMRFFGNMTQSQIANELGISQMHVSRLLAQTLRQLRTTLVEA